VSSLCHVQSRHVCVVLPRNVRVHAGQRAHEVQPDFHLVRVEPEVLAHDAGVESDLDIPIVPVHANANIPPIPPARRYAELGTYLAEAIAAAPSAQRMALIASGHLATEVGGPRQFLGGNSPDDDFDRDAVGWMRDGDLESAIAGCSFARLAAAGNVTAQYLNFVTALAAAGGRPATFAEGTPSRFAAGPFFSWDMSS